ncbi:hypothetical protein GCM10011512_03350 [Tersicoccus solisilvae]|uniref:Fungal lipase-like domain-containing protein n=1 Tax=Tersicoccus solisilvae TaxID=1882339 RepID=A0ABQ1NL93_9MICC|nr:hypothetical protein [Tersicoccus solisilvae]GGC80015.1 hypothetical protein GCM10011512_03350 [Tersicoccus solisilvae]
MSYSRDPSGTGAGQEPFVPVLPPSAGSTSGTLTVRGGVDGIACSLEELDEAAARVQVVAEELCRVSAALAAITGDLWGLPPSVQLPAMASRLAGGDAQLAAGTSGSRLLELAAGVRTARAAYQQSELIALAAVTARRHAELTGLRTIGSAAAGAPAAGPLAGATAGVVAMGLGAWLAQLTVRARAVGYRDAVQDELATLPRLIDPTDPPRVLPMLDRLLRDSGHTTGALAWVTLTAVAAGRRGGVVTAGTLRVDARGGPTTAPAAPATLSTITGNLAAAAARSRAGPDGVARSAVTVRRLDGGAAPVWEVDIPGTTGWDLADGPGLFDLEGNADAITATDATGTTVRPTQVGSLVTAALAAAGAPRGARVILAGHSQGGIHAAALAADPAFRGRYDVRQVVTAGSPIAGFTIPSGTAVLSLEHRDDIVPALDGRPNMDARNRVTVTGSAPPAGSGASPLQTIAAAHGLAGYRRMAAEADGATDRSVAAQRESLRDLTRGVTRQTVWVVEGRDVPLAGAAPDVRRPPSRRRAT